jgi:mediator of RNA polymerase II transcription subunit 19, fungi type
MPASVPVKPDTSHYYFVNYNEEFPPLQPSLFDDVIRLYGIDELAKSLARTKPDGSKGVKLRKSYKSHVADLPGKHAIPIEDKSFAHIALMPDNPDFTKPEIKPFSMEYLGKVIDLEKSGPNGVPGFDASKLALSGLDITDGKREKKRKAVVASPGQPQPALQPEAKRRHVQVKFD